MKEMSPVCAGPLEAPLSKVPLPKPIPFFILFFYPSVFAAVLKTARCVMCVCV